MSNFEETIARMKGLYTYGKELNENNSINSHTLEYHAVAADGKSYGIVRECNKYYIKSAPKDKEMIAEAYDYIGGYCNKGNYEYKSYANALKNFELKMSSINEACDSNINISTLDPFKKEEFLVESTEKMREEIARQRQIMYNASMIMNESTEISASRKKDGTVMYDGENPEAKTGKKGDEGQKPVKAQPEYNGSKTNGVNKKVGPFNNNPSCSKGQLKENSCCEKCGKEPCECKNCNEENVNISDEPLMPNTENWGTEGIGKGKDPKQIGWEMDGQQNVNEETNEWDEGLPNSSGVGDADTDHNNDPFNKSINESDEENDDETIEYNIEDNSDELENDDSFSDEYEESSTDVDFDDGLNNEFYDDNFDEENFDEENFDDETDDFDDEDNDDDLKSEIESLKAELEALKAQINGDDNLDNKDNFAEEDEFTEEDDFNDEDFNDGDFNDEDEIEYKETDKEIDEMNESKQRKMDKIVESVVKRFLKEDELHVFGKHPGYRKKPMELPTTGEDQNQWGRDWNDESVHSEEPFGKQIGNGDPFKELVNAVTKDVMYQLKKGIPIEGDKKKEN